MRVTLFRTENYLLMVDKTISSSFYVNMNTGMIIPASQTSEKQRAEDEFFAIAAHYPFGKAPKLGDVKLMPEPYVEVGEGDVVNVRIKSGDMMTNFLLSEARKERLKMWKNIIQTL